MIKTAIIVGSAGDIGRALARRFLMRGVRVAGFDVMDHDQLVSGLSDADKELFVPEHVDITNVDSVRRAFAMYNSVDVLVNNAGGISAHSLAATTEESWARDLELNLTGVWRCMNEVLPGMVENRSGVIVNTASVNGIGIYGHPGYSVAKAGLIHLTKFAAVEYGKYGIRSVAVAPGTVKTRAWKDRLDQDPDILSSAMKWYPSRLASEPDDVAKMIDFAAFEAPPTLNGAVLELDGGLLAGHDAVASAFCGENL